ncbi:pyridoxamine 5'-phosphate oxidase family protein [Thermodesulfobacteriota bacterium]
MKNPEALAKMHEMAPFSFLATAEGDQPCLRAMTHYIDEELHIWYPSVKDCGKVRQMLANPKVAVSFFYTTYGGPPLTVYGTAEIIEDETICREIWEHYGASIAGIVPEGPGSGNFVVIKITPGESVNNTY